MASFGRWIPKCCHTFSVDWCSFQLKVVPWKLISLYLPCIRGCNFDRLLSGWLSLNHLRWWDASRLGEVPDQGPISLRVFPSQFKFNRNFVLLSPRFQQSDCYKILYITQKHCFRGMCKNLLRSDGKQWNYSEAKFPSNGSCEQKVIIETGPCVTS